ncbi:MAG: N-acetyl-gamma-glutamyl-phosphate reductase [Woeseiaceae bacterium]
MKPYPAIVIGAGGYVGGEFLRLIEGHPQLELAGAVSDSATGQPIASVFPQYRSVGHTHQFISTETALEQLADHRQIALFSAAPHGGAAGTLARFIHTAEAVGCQLHIVDASADFRYASAEAYEAVYGSPHAAPELLGAFSSAVPEHLAETTTAHVGHPGCFATAMQLGLVPLLKADCSDDQVFANGITGATGAGKTPIATTHHPERHSNLFAYKSLSHRHAPEVLNHVNAATGKSVRLHFTPHSGPFSRGIHMTLNARNTNGISADQLREQFANYYDTAAFVQVVDGMPRLKNVIASNYAEIGIETDGEAIAICIVIDNLMKGAAGGCVQWMNRLLDFDETSGLTAAAPGWT